MELINSIHRSIVTILAEELIDIAKIRPEQPITILKEELKWLDEKSPKVAIHFVRLILSRLYPTFAVKK